MAELKVRSSCPWPVVHGISMACFPTTFLVAFYEYGQTGLTVSIPHMLNGPTEQIVKVIDHCLQSDAGVAPVQEGEDRWVSTIRHLAYNYEEFIVGELPV